ncbi:MAG TPA: flagellar basal body rod protein FlgC [Aquifex aeolicus]|uniref:Flagellar basal-body rod protein FlgC n=1 Tax=Aquifex aeolicus TaxID=63363 RepID=A0A9D1CF99_AQUAO|nr:flagellar basal body rod protein FlgC [Aquificales bacterium]HIP86218.1 flagellar basal body rod protein FlgC [Aquifex sp.]HIP97927.1 flagellar basal body rod protein FlgC [Aquifex aeolicus]HIQ26156.1 flagellar basal body rod protein FlgC [Aquifex aeolicus]
MDFKVFDVIASGLAAERIRLNTIASNLANLESYKKNGKPYKRLEPVFRAMVNEETYKSGIAKVKVEKIVQSPYPVVKVYDPSNPLADKEGYVEKPNVNIVKEMTDLITASRVYQANLNALNLNRDLILKTLEMWR